MKRKNLKGKKFGKLTVLYEAGPEEKRHYDTFWICACECGGKISAGTQALQNGQVQSCGCLASAKRHEKKLNKHVQEGEIVKILLNNGAEAIIDAEDYEKVKNITWHCHHGYACAYHENQYVTMHQIILGQKYVDHIDMDRLNNRKMNLRPATPQQNSWNKKPRSDNQSGYKGVYRGTSAWIATIQAIYLGSFKTKEEAAKAYDAKAKELYGEYAKLNFPEDADDPLMGLPVGPTIYGKERRQTTDDHLPHHPAHHVLLRYDGRPAETPEMTAAGESACDHEERRKCLWEPDAPSRS